MLKLLDISTDILKLIIKVPIQNMTGVIQIVYSLIVKMQRWLDIQRTVMKLKQGSIRKGLPGHIGKMC